MPSPNTRYSPEVRRQTAEFILSSGKSATGVAEEMGIDTNTVCKWVREYRRAHDMPTYAEEKGIKTPTPVSSAEFRQKAKDLEHELKRTISICCPNAPRISGAPQLVRVGGLWDKICNTWRPSAVLFVP